MADYQVVIRATLDPSGARVGQAELTSMLGQVTAATERATQAQLAAYRGMHSAMAAERAAFVRSENVAMDGLMVRARAVQAELATMRAMAMRPSISEISAAGGVIGGSSNSAFAGLDRAARAAASYKPSTQQTRAIATANEQYIANLLSGQWTGTGNKPLDVLTSKMGIEVKTLIAASNSKLTMHGDSLAKKYLDAEAQGLKPLTVAIDQRAGKMVEMYYKEGFGSFQLSSMTKTTPSELQALFGQKMAAAERALSTREKAYFYHGTDPANLAGISRRGLRLSDGTYGPGTYLTGPGFESAADTFGTARLRTQLPPGTRLRQDPFAPASVKAYQTMGRGIPPEYLEILSDGKYVPLAEYVARQRSSIADIAAAGGVKGGSSLRLPPVIAGRNPISGQIMSAEAWSVEMAKARAAFTSLEAYGSGAGKIMEGVMLKTSSGIVQLAGNVPQLKQAYKGFYETVQAGFWGNQGAIAALDKFGISAKKAAEDPQAAFLQFTQQLKGIKGSAEQVTAAMPVLGKKYAGNAPSVGSATILTEAEVAARSAEASAKDVVKGVEAAGAAGLAAALGAGEKHVAGVRTVMAKVESEVVKGTTKTGNSFQGLLQGIFTGNYRIFQAAGSLFGMSGPAQIVYHLGMVASRAGVAGTAMKDLDKIILTNGESVVALGGNVKSLENLWLRFKDRVSAASSSRTPGGSLAGLDLRAAGLDLEKTFANPEQAMGKLIGHLQQMGPTVERDVLLTNVFGSSAVAMGKDIDEATIAISGENAAAAAGAPILLGMSAATLAVVAAVAALVIVVVGSLVVMGMLIKFAISGAEKFAKWGDEIWKLQAKTAISAEALSGLLLIAKETGVNAEQLGRAFSRLEVNIERGIVSPSSAAGRGIKALGLSMEELKRMTPEQQVSEVAKRLADLTDENVKAYASSALLGFGFQKLAPMLAELGGNLEMAELKAKRFHLELSQVEIEKAHEFTVATHDLGLAWQGFEQTAGESALPAMIAFIERLTDVLANNTDAWRSLGEAVGVAIEGFRVALAELPGMAKLVAGEQIFPVNPVVGGYIAAKGAYEAYEAAQAEGQKIRQEKLLISRRDFLREYYVSLPTQALEEQAKVTRLALSRPVDQKEMMAGLPVEVTRGKTPEELTAIWRVEQMKRVSMLQGILTGRKGTPEEIDQNSKRGLAQQLELAKQKLQELYDTARPEFKMRIDLEDTHKLTQDLENIRKQRHELGIDMAAPLPTSIAGIKDEAEQNSKLLTAVTAVQSAKRAQRDADIQLAQLVLTQNIPLVDEETRAQTLYLTAIHDRRNAELDLSAQVQSAVMVRNKALKDEQSTLRDSRQAYAELQLEAVKGAETARFGALKQSIQLAINTGGEPALIEKLKEGLAAEQDKTRAPILDISANVLKIVGQLQQSLAAQANPDTHIMEAMAENLKALKEKFVVAEEPKVVFNQKAIDPTNMLGTILPGIFGQPNLQTKPLFGQPSVISPWNFQLPAGAVSGSMSNNLAAPSTQSAEGIRLRSQNAGKGFIDWLMGRSDTPPSSSASPASPWSKPGGTFTFNGPVQMNVPGSATDRAFGPGMTATPKGAAPVSTTTGAPGGWSLPETAAKVKEWYQSQYGRPLPIGAYGLNAGHKAMGFKYHDAFDVGIDPKSDQGAALRAELKSLGVPFSESTGPSKDKLGRTTSTGYHFHIGPPGSFTRTGPVAGVQEGVKSHQTDAEKTRSAALEAQLTDINSLYAAIQKADAEEALYNKTKKDGYVEDAAGQKHTLEEIASLRVIAAIKTDAISRQNAAVASTTALGLAEHNTALIRGRDAEFVKQIETDAESARATAAETTAKAIVADESYLFKLQSGNEGELRRLRESAASARLKSMTSLYQQIVTLEDSLAHAGEDSAQRVKLAWLSTTDERLKSDQSEIESMLKMEAAHKFASLSADEVRALGAKQAAAASGANPFGLPTPGHSFNIGWQFPVTEEERQAQARKKQLDAMAPQARAIALDEDTRQAAVDKANIAIGVSDKNLTELRKNNSEIGKQEVVLAEAARAAAAQTTVASIITGESYLFKLQSGNEEELRRLRENAADARIKAHTALFGEIATLEDKIAHVGEDSAERVKKAKLDAIFAIRDASTVAGEQIVAAEVKIGDQTVLHTDQVMAGVEASMASHKGITQLWTDFYTGMTDAIATSIGGLFGTLTAKMGAFGQVLNQILTDLMRLAVDRVFRALLQSIGGGGGGGGGGLLGGLFGSAVASGGGAGASQTGGGNSALAQMLFGGRGMAQSGSTGGNVAAFISQVGGHAPGAGGFTGGAGPGGFNFANGLNDITSSTGGFVGGTAGLPSFNVGGGANAQTQQALFSNLLRGSGMSNLSTVSGLPAMAGSINIGEGLPTVDQFGAHTGTPLHADQVGAGAGAAPAAAPGLMQSLGAMLPMLGLSLGMGVGGSLGGQSSAGQVLGSIGGGMLGGMAGLAISNAFFGGTAMSTIAAVLGISMTALAAITFGVGGVLLVGAMLLARNKQRRVDETTRGQLNSDVVTKVSDLLHRAQAGTITQADAQKEWDTIHNDFLTTVNGMKDAKTKKIALAWWANDLEPFYLPKILAAAKTGEDAAAVTKTFVPTYAEGGGWSEAGPAVARGGGDWVTAPRASRGLFQFAGNFDRRDDMTVRVSRGEPFAAMTPDQFARMGGRPAFRAAGVPMLASGGVHSPPAQNSSETNESSPAPVIIVAFGDQHIRELIAQFPHAQIADLVSQNVAQGGSLPALIARELQQRGIM